MRFKGLLRVAAIMLAAALAVISCATVSFAEAAGAETTGTETIGAADGAMTIYKQDFESFDVSQGDGEAAVFSDAKENKPSGFNDFIGDGERSGAVIAGDKISGSKSLRLMRYDGGVANMRVNGLTLGALGEGSKVTFSFTFRYKTLGNYGFSVILGGIPESPGVEDYGGGTRNIFSAGTDDELGKDVLYAVNPAGGTFTVTDALKADTDYTVEAVFTLGSDKYKVLINGEEAGEYTYIGKLTNITAIRIDCHDWAEENDTSKAQKGSCHVNEVYFDNIMLTAVSSGSAPETSDKLYKFEDGEPAFIEDFENLEPVSEYERSNSGSDTFFIQSELPFLNSLGTPFVNIDSWVRIIDGDKDFDGVAFAAKDFLDLRFWIIPKPVDVSADVCVSFAIKVTELTGGFYFCVSNAVEGTPTTSESRGGAVLKLEPAADGSIAIKNALGEQVGKFDKNTHVTLATAFFMDTNKYVVFLNGEMLPGSTSAYPEEFAGVQALRFDIEGTDTAVIFDDITVESGYLEEADGAPQTGGDPEETATPDAGNPTDEEPTPEATEEPAAETGKPAGSTADSKVDPTPKPKNKPGCGSTISCAYFLIAAACTALAVKRRKQ